MGQDSSKVIVPGKGRFWQAPPDTLFPGQILKITGAPTAAVVSLTVAGSTSQASLSSSNTPAQNCLAIGQALAGNAAVGQGRTFVFPGFDGWTFLIIIDQVVVSQTLTATATFTGGSSPAVAINTAGKGVWTPFTEVGHTSKDNPLQVNRSGGDVTTQGSWQADNIDSSTAAVGWALAYNLLQHDVPSLKLYHGSNAIVAPDGSVQASQSSPTSTEAALFLLVQNGQKALWRGYPRVGTLGADGESWDTTKLAQLPVASTVLASATQSYGYAVSQAGVAA